MTNLETIKLDQRKRRFIKFGFLGTLCVSIAYIALIIDPLEKIVQDKLSIYEGSFLFKLWKKPPLEVFVSTFLFNITNAADFLSGKDAKVKYEQVGPYVYQEYLEHHNTTFNENGTLSYIPLRRVRFVPEKSVGDPMTDIIITPNIPLLAATTVASDLSFFAALALSSLTKALNSPPILNITVYDFLWGYEDHLVKLASNIVPGFITFEKLGLLDRMFDDGINEVTMHLPKIVKELRRTNQSTSGTDNNPVSSALTDSEDYDYEEPPADIPYIRDYSIDTWNGSPGLHQWGFKDGEKNTPCNTLRGSFDGTLFPQNISKTEVFKVYRKAFCRTLPIKYSHTGKVDQLEAYWFQLSDNAFASDPDDPESTCYCDSSRKCLKKGLGKITPCYYNIPVAVSLPHFYKSDPSLLEGIEGLKPIPDEHDAVIILQPKLGVAMKVNLRIQINLLVDKIKFNQNLLPFQNTVLPLMWVEIAVERLTPDLILLVQMLFNVLPYIQTGCIYLLTIIGVSLFAVAALSYMCIPRISTDYPKQDIRYSTIDIIPYIKREIEKCVDKDEAMA